jgi:hypothetical protein
MSLSVKEWKSALRGTVCPLCAQDELIHIEVNELGAATVVCVDGHRWSLPAPLPAEERSGRIGVLEELNAYETLAGLFVDASASYREHGIIEHLFAASDPNAYQQLVSDYGHTSFSPKRHTASAMIARALGQLAREGQLAYQRHKGTGYWSYNSDVGYWTLSPGPDPDDLVTWVSWATDHGIHPADWPATGYKHDDVAR